MRYIATMSVARHLTNSVDDYIIIEANSTTRHEYIDGEIYAMAGGTPEHGALANRAARLLEGSLKHCLSLSSDVRIHIPSLGMITYPDVSFVCGKVEKSTMDTDAIINPALLVEVTSKTTESYDRTQKLLAYQTIPSLCCVIFVSHREQRVTAVERGSDGWATREYGQSQLVQVTSPQALFAVDDLYSVLSQFG